MTALTLIQGDGERTVTRPCRVCGVGHYGECQILARHIEHMALRGLAVKTRENRVSQIRLAAAALPVPLLDAGKADLRAWRAGLRREPGGILNSVSHVSQFLLWAVREGLIDANPADGLPVPRRPRRLPRPISQRDLFAALAAAPQPIRAWLVLGAFCGLRCVEIAGLKAGSVRLDEEPPVLIVTAESTKGGRTERVIPLTAFTVAELRPLAAGSGYVFRAAAGGPHQPHTISHRANAFLRSAGIRDEFHACRHYFGTHSYRGVRDLLAVADLMGHASVETTALYALYDSPQARKAVESIPVPAGR